MGRWHRFLPCIFLLGTPVAAAPPPPTLSATVTADAAYWTAGRLDAVAPIAKGPGAPKGRRGGRAGPVPRVEDQPLDRIEPPT